MSDHLHARMRAALAQLELCSHTAAPGYDPKSRSGATDSRNLCGGDKGASFYARRYGPPFHEATERWPGCQTDEERLAVIDETLAEVEHLKGGEGLARRLGAVELEKPEERDRRIIKGWGDHNGIGRAVWKTYAGWTAIEVATAERVLPSHVKKLRLEHNIDPDTGRPMATPQTTDDKRRAAREMRARNVSTREVAQRLGVSQTLIMRWTRDMSTTTIRKAA